MSAPRYESRQELSSKADYEGGILDMLFGYGLSVDDVPEDDVELREAIAACLAAKPAIAHLESLLPEPDDEEAVWNGGH